MVFVTAVHGVRPCAIKYGLKSEHNVWEAKILSKLVSHTHVVSIIQSGFHVDFFDENFYIALDKCQKHNLHQFCDHRKESGLLYDVSSRLKFSKQVIDGMKYVHEKLIFQKDLKSSNILISTDEKNN